MNILGTLGKILAYPVTGPVSGFLALARTIQERAEEAQEKTNPRARLMELESRLATGDISPEEYKEEEDSIMKQIEEELQNAEDSADNPQSTVAGDPPSS